VTRAEWAVAYVLQFGVAQARATGYAEGESEFLTQMAQDLELVGNGGAYFHRSRASTQIIVELRLQGVIKP
jgi:hypothetical protein